MAPSYSSPSLVASVAASPTPANTISTPSNNSHTTFRSLRSLLPFGPNKSPNAHTSASNSANLPSYHGHSSKGSFSGFGSMRRKSLTKEQERKTSLNNLLPVISIDRSSIDQTSPRDGYMRQATSFSYLEPPAGSQDHAKQAPNEFGLLQNDAVMKAAPVLRSISPGPPLSADLSTIIEADSSCTSKADHPSSKLPSPSASPSQHQPRALGSNGGNETDASFDLNTNQIAKEVYNAIMEKDAASPEDWLAAEKPIVIDADTDEDDIPLPPNRPGDSASINMDTVDPSIVALLSPHNLPQKSFNGMRKQQPVLTKGQPSHPSSLPTNSPLGGSPQSRRTTPSSSSIPRFRSLTEPITPGSTSTVSADATFKTSSSVTPTANIQRVKSDMARQRRIPSHSTLYNSSTPETHITVHTDSVPGTRTRTFGSAPPTPSTTHAHNIPRIPTLANRLQVNSSSELRLGGFSFSASRTPSPTIQIPQLLSTQGSTSSASTIPTAPHTPNSPFTSYTPNSITNLTPSISRQTSQSSSIFKPRLAAHEVFDDASKDPSHESFDETSTTTTTATIVNPGYDYGRASLDSRRPGMPQTAAPNSKVHVLVTSTPFKRVEDTIGVKRTWSEDDAARSPIGSPQFDGMEEMGDSLPPSSLATPHTLMKWEQLPSVSPPTPSKLGGMFRPPFRSRKRSMSVQDSHRTAHSLMGGGRKAENTVQAQLQHHHLNGVTRSNSSLSGRLTGMTVREEAKEDVDDAPPPRPPLHDWLGPRSVKALRAAGLLDDRDRDRDKDDQPIGIGKASRERSGSVATSVMSGGSGKTSLGGFGRLIPSRSNASEYSPQYQSHQHGHVYHGRSQSRMAFSDAGGPTSAASSSRRGSGTFSYLMHSPTLTTSTSGSRDRDRDTPRSASTAPTTPSSASLAYLRERDEIRELKDKHATETGALLGALSDSQRTTRMLREENHDLRERLERMADVDAENEELRREVRGLKREVNELKVQLLTGGGTTRGLSRSGWLSVNTTNGSGGGRRSGLSTPVEEKRERLHDPSGTPSLEVSPHKDGVLRPSSWIRLQGASPSTSVISLTTHNVSHHGTHAPSPEPHPETPRHRRCPSDTSSIFPVLPSNMSMLMHEEHELGPGSNENGEGSENELGHLGHGTLEGFSPSQGKNESQAHVSSQNQTLMRGNPDETRPKPIPSRKAGLPGQNGNTAALPTTVPVNRTDVRASTASISPTTANFSMVTGSPGSLFLRPEHEVHLGDLETFSLDFGRLEPDQEQDMGGDGPDDW